MENFKKPISVLPVINDENKICGLLRLHDLVQADRMRKFIIFIKSFFE